jgi:beta-lactamase regulating signal transducer with metallopeptidase domain
MIAAWMLYTLSVSFLLYTAAHAAEFVARACRLPTRIVWAGVMLAAVALSASVFVGAAVPSRSSLTPPNGLGIKRFGTLVVTTLPASTPTPAPRASVGLRMTNALDVVQHASARVLALPRAIEGAPLRTWDTPLLIVWLAASCIVLVWLGSALVQLAKLERSLSPSLVGGRRIFISSDVGPAVVGALNPQIVIPSWVLRLTHASRAAVVEHELAHVGAHDPELLYAGVLLAALMPWNLALWLMIKRMRDAIEMDCDQRVVGDRGRSIDEYARLVLEVYERSAAQRAPTMAFAARQSTLERRIRRMTDRRRHKTITVLSSGAVMAAFSVAPLMMPAPAFRYWSWKSAIRLRLPECTARRTASPSSSANCAIEGPVVLYTIDSSHMLVAFRNPTDNSEWGKVSYAIFRAHTSTAANVSWRSVASIEFRDRDLVLANPTTGQPMIAIGNDESELRARYATAKTLIPASMSEYVDDPRITWDVMWDLPVSSRCARTYPGPPPFEAEFHDTTAVGRAHAFANLKTAPFACVVRQGQAMRLVRY